MKFIDRVTPYELECTDAVTATGEFKLSDHYGEYLTEVMDDDVLHARIATSVNERIARMKAIDRTNDQFVYSMVINAFMQHLYETYNVPADELEYLNHLRVVDTFRMIHSMVDREGEQCEKIFKMVRDAGHPELAKLIYDTMTTDPEDEDAPTAKILEFPTPNSTEED